MASTKEESNASSLFGDSTGDDPFSQLQQQSTISEGPTKQVNEEKDSSVKEQSKPVVGDVSTLFSNNEVSNADIFFSSNNPTSQSVNPPSTSNASLAAAFFEQPQPSDSFFDNLGQNQTSSLTQPFNYEQNQQQQQQEAISNVSLTHAYDPNAYASYDYNQQEQIQGQEQQPYDQSQWIQFDPNVHYYYDEQGQVHYYDPNTNQEYDMSQFEYNQQGQSYEYQYDPQYAEYYNQQSYDPNMYTTTNDNSGIYDNQQTYIPAQANYNTNAYTPAQQSADASQSYYEPAQHTSTILNSSKEVQEQSYHPQEYVSTTTNNVAEVPAQVQSEQTIDTQSYSPEQQDQYSIQNYVSAEYNEQQQEYSYQTQKLPANNASLTANLQPQGQLEQDQYVPVDYNNTAVQQDYSQFQTEFEEEVLQPSASQPPLSMTSFKSSSTAPPKNDISSLPNSTPIEEATQRGSYDANSVNLEQQQEHSSKQTENMDDLDDLVLGKSDNQQRSSDNLMTMDNYATHAYEENQTMEQNTGTDGETDFSSQYNNQKMPQLHMQMEPIIFSNELPSEVGSDAPGEPKQEQAQMDETQQQGDHTADKPDKNDEKQLTNKQTEPDHTEHPVESYLSYETEQIMYEQNNYEPNQASSYQLEQTNNYEPEQLISLEPHSTTLQYDQATGNEAYQPNQYVPEQTTQENTVGAQPLLANYEPEQNQSYGSYETGHNMLEQITSYTPQQEADYKPEQQLNNYEPQQVKSAPSDPISSFDMPNYSTPQEQQQRVLSPPPRTGSAKAMVSPPPIQSFYQPQRSNSVAESEQRRHSGVSFPGYNYNNQFPIERSATVPPPIVDRIVSPRPQLIPCPDPKCEGENKPKAKFCCECGRPLASLSRSTTPSSNLFTGNFGVEPFNPISSSFDMVTEQVQRSALDDKKDAMVQKLKDFMDASVVIHNTRDVEEKRKYALAYIEGRLNKFDDDSKELLWRLVKLMLEHHEHNLGDGGELDKSIMNLISSQDALSSNTNLDKLENFLVNGDREGACRFASEQDMWGHALIIASSVEGNLFKDIVSQFISRELFSSTTELIPQITDNKKALRMLYSVFNGAGADAVTAFVKQSGDEEPVYSEETLKGWKHALALILANRSSNDQEAIYGLGDKLKQQGTMNNEARLCYMLSPNQLSDTDKDNKIVGDDIYTDLDSLYLAEFYEFVTNASIQQNFKLMLAWWLTELGFTQESQYYCDSIVSTLRNNSDYVPHLENLKKLGELCPMSNESDNVTSLLTKQNFDTLIGSIEEKMTFPTYTTGYGYSDQTNDKVPENDYGYGNSYTVSADTIPHAVTSPFAQQAKGIRSPFQENSNGPIQPIKSPFQSNIHPISSPLSNTQQFVGASAQTNGDENGGAWWDSNHVQTNTFNNQYQPYEPQANSTTTDYQPNAYMPPTENAVETNGSKPSWDEDDDLGFGNNSNKKASTTTTTTTEITDNDKKETETKEEKQDETTAKKEKERHGWGLFSLFGRKDKEPTEEKKAIKANLGEENTFYYDEKEKRWVNKLNDSKPAAATLPPPPKASTPQPTTMTPPVGSSSLKPNSMPPRINSAPPIGAVSSGPPNTPPTARRAGAGRKPMRSRYVDVLNTQN